MFLVQLIYDNYSGPGNAMENSTETFTSSAHSILGMYRCVGRLFWPSLGKTGGTGGKECVKVRLSIKKILSSATEDQLVLSGS